MRLTLWKVRHSERELAGGCGDVSRVQIAALLFFFMSITMLFHPGCFAWCVDGIRTGFHDAS